MYNYSLLFELKQHTSLIHFQYDHVGATLRPTEVKTKLDRYIWQQEWQNDFEKGKSYMVGYSPGKSKDIRERFTGVEQYRALDYKIQLVSNSSKMSEIPQRMSLYFGNMSNDVDEKKAKHFVFSQGGIQGSILVKDATLIDIIQKHITSFFLLENFGTRQSKGFGSFELVKLNGQSPKFTKPSAYFFKIEQTEEAALREYIDIFYRSLRSGLNLKNADKSDKLYFKSLLFQYAKTQNHQWDKRKIRKYLFGRHLKFQAIEENRRDPEGTVRYDHGTSFLYRDMLGLSSSQTWIYYDRATVNKSAKNPEIDRFKSPITFKPFKRNNHWEVYIIATPVPSEMQNTAFIIESGGKKTEMNTPEFDLQRYLQFAFSFFPNDDALEDYLGEHNAPREARILKSIYQQLRKTV